MLSLGSVVSLLVIFCLLPQGPVFAEPILKAEDVDKLNPDFDIRAELGYVYEAITLTRHNLEGKVPLFGFCGAPVRWKFCPFVMLVTRVEHV